MASVVDKSDFAALPLDILLNVCAMLEDRDVIRLGATCKALYWTTQNSVIWRTLSLELWGFCNISTVQATKHRWKAYYQKRRYLELKMDTGKSGNYQAKTLRGHDLAITDSLYINTTDGNIDNIGIANCVSCSLDASIRIWDIAEGNTLAMAKLDSGLVCLEISPSGNHIYTGDVNGKISCLKITDLEMIGGVETSNPVIFLQHLTHPNMKSRMLVSTHQDGAIMTWLEFDKKTTEGCIPEVFKTQYCGQLIHSKKGLYLLPYKGNNICVILAVNANSLAVYDINKMFDVKCQAEDSFVTNLECTNTVIHGGWVSSLDVPHFVCLTLIGLELFRVELSNIAGGQDLYSLANVNLNSLSTCMSICHSSNILVGTRTGNLQLYSINSTKPGIEFKILQTFNDHKNTINSICSTKHRVMTCSSDFSIRVYVWQKSQKGVVEQQLISKYTLLGGSLARNSDPNFTHVSHNEMSCVGTNGKLLKAYTFKN